jgi:hypothetical protein
VRHPWTLSFGATGLMVPAAGMGTWQTFDVEGPRPPRASAPWSTRPRDRHDALRLVADAAATPSACWRARWRDTGTALIATKVWRHRSPKAGARSRRLDWFGGVVDVYQIHNLVNWRAQLAVLRCATPVRSASSARRTTTRRVRELRQSSRQDESGRADS